MTQTFEGRRSGNTFLLVCLETLLDYAPPFLATLE
jgi:hypothetical protein